MNFAQTMETSIGYARSVLCSFGLPPSSSSIVVPYNSNGFEVYPSFRNSIRNQKAVLSRYNVRKSVGHPSQCYLLL
jgi:hypothetical protein